MTEQKICARRDEKNCQGRITLEHALLYAGKQIDDDFAKIWLCAYHHGVDEFWNCHGQNKRRHKELALAQATEQDKKKYPLLWRKEYKKKEIV